MPELPAGFDPEGGDFEFQHEEFGGLGDLSGGAPEGAEASPQQEEPEHKPFVRSDRKVGRNEPCPCGSGKKYKHCHGRLN